MGKETIIEKSEHPSEANVFQWECAISLNVQLTLYEPTWLKHPGFVMHSTTGRHVILDSGWEVIYCNVLTEHVIFINTLRTTVSTCKASLVFLTNKQTQPGKLFI